jgi:alpha-beta hydrolase superfamily lysophospholipase
MRWKWTLTLLVAAISYGLYSTGLYVYFKSIARPIQPSGFETADQDIVFKVPRPRGTVLLLHGMNFEASKLIPLGEVLHQMGYKVLIPRLAAHRGDAEDTKRDPTAIWQQQFEKWRTEIQGPLVCMGYSLGGLLVTSEHLKGRLQCERFILFAPALAARTSLSTVKFVEKIWPAERISRSKV